MSNIDRVRIIISTFYTVFCSDCKICASPAFLSLMFLLQQAQHVRDIFFYAGTVQRTVVDDPLQQKYYQVHTRTINEMVGSCQMKYDALCLNTI